jgi:uncharacterized protein (DUF1800 family)
VPTLNEANVRHLLRRTEIVDRPDRVARLLTLGTIEAAVADVMNVPANPPSASFDGVPADSNWRRGVRLAEHWLDQMATVEHSFGERMAFFWHGHICSELGKVSSAPAMQEQIDLFRTRGLGPAVAGRSVVELVKTMSTQVAMLRYLDNDQNFANSPNQNFARELMELFLLGVGNYTEADVEAATAAWTGHTRPRWDIDEYVFQADRHDNAPQQFLGRTINAGAAQEGGTDTIDVILGLGAHGVGTIPPGAEKNRGRPSNEVAADFLSYKLWQEFGEAASGTVPAGVAAAMRSALIDNDFAIRPWVEAMLSHDDFYASATRTGLVRQPVEFIVAVMVALGLDAERAGQLWMLDQTGQRPLYPPNVSGWRPNGYWVNASAMGARHQVVQGCLWALTRDTWDGDDGYIQFGDDPANRLTKIEIQGRWQDDIDPIPDEEFLDRLIEYTGLVPPASTRDRVLAHLAHPDVAAWMRLDALLLFLSAPEMHIA